MSNKPREFTKRKQNALMFIYNISRHSITVKGAPRLIDKSESVPNYLLMIQPLASNQLNYNPLAPDALTYFKLYHYNEENFYNAFENTDNSLSGLTTESWRVYDQRNSNITSLKNRFSLYELQMTVFEDLCRVAEYLNME